ncbi:glutathione ABC transporter substrate-binding protein [Anaerobacillus alkaliphilus]|uniref:Glutathione ABC transporter substrate-binding protein n=1 Tax=Anaerobacillus alkaliphilus TaxID=1548597 RepID=A0A4V1LGX1_9BACI|nr:glutathione ABC transporter substrate-binding protein [Anaerobacillus alkaliphilus]RXJ04215.1 glutathione ABC transporter substrate-binding protein [Anaerobacillus alkaliphilus]
MKSVRLFSFAIMFVLLLIVGACSSDKPATTEEPTETKEPVTENKEPVQQEPTLKPLVVAIEAEPTSLDPHNATDTNSATVQSVLLEGLLAFDENMNLVKVLATEYSFNEEATEITFQLREGVTFHDGTAFNAEVVKVNLDFVRNRDNGMARASFFSFIDEVVVNNDYSVTVRSKEANSAMASYLAHSAAAFKSVDEINKKIDNPEYNADRNPIGTGPFKFLEWRDSAHVKVVPFDNYWNEDGKAKVENITFKPVVEASTRVNMLKTGEVDIVFPLPTLSADELEADANIDVFTGSSTETFYIGMNVSLDKYKDVRVRKAMNHAVNKDSLIALVLDGYGQVLDSAIAPAVYGYAQQPIYEYDQGKAKELLAEAGQEGGFDAVLWTRNSTEFLTVAENVAIQLGAIGINVDVQAYETGTLFDMLDAGDGTDLFIGRWSPGTGEADWGLRPNFASDRIPPNYNNAGYYINEDLDQLFNQALQSPDPDETLRIYAEAQKVIYDDAPWVFLYVPDTIIAKRNELKGITVRATGAVVLTGAWKE